MTAVVPSQRYPLRAGWGHTLQALFYMGKMASALLFAAQIITTLLMR
jgi:hypothetical protein